MDLKQLRYFTAVAQSGSYTKAADLLGVAQPVLSRQIRLLETELRHNLLDRHGRGVSLTDAGRLLLEHSRIILRQVDLVYDDLHSKNGKLGGHIVLGLPPTAARLLSVDIIRRFRRELPDARLSITEGLSAQLQERLLQGRADIVLLYNPPPHTDVEKVLLHEEQLCLIAPPDDPAADRPVTPEELALLPLIAPTAPNTFRQLIERALAQQHLSPHVVLEIDSVDTMSELVADGMGYAVLPACAAGRMRRQRPVCVRPITGQAFTNRLFLATSNKRALTRTQRETLRLLQQSAAALPQTV